MNVKIHISGTLFHILGWVPQKGTFDISRLMFQLPKQYINDKGIYVQVNYPGLLSKLFRTDSG